MLDTQTRTAIDTVARAFDLDPAALAAVAHVESNLVAHALIDGRREPLIRFEGYYFDRRLSAGTQAKARAAGLASPTAGAVKNPASQAARWALLARARAINAKAADESTSWGLGQVMGAHWAWLGFASVDALVAEARDGVEGQLRLMARYIDRAGLSEALARQDWPAFARGYNGPGYARNGYDVKLADAYARYAARDWPSSPQILAHGARGPAVSALQRLLNAHGHALTIDGKFGPATQDAVRLFQGANGLRTDGIAGPATFAALEARANPIRILFRRLAALFKW